jgi:predicted GIY-YIG superfamily endonuclease
MQNYNVYWIHTKQHSDPYKEGYIGVTNNIKNRINAHKYVKKTILYNAFNKYGDDMIVDIIHQNITEDNALIIENNYRPDERIGWNIVPGGGKPPVQSGPSPIKGTKWTDEQRKRLSVIRKANPRLISEEEKNKRSIALKGKPSGRKGEKRNIIKCPHCGKEGGVNGMIQWHFDKCKKRGI